MEERRQTTDHGPQAIQSRYIEFGASLVHYLKTGSGKKILVCFHGYGESSSNFNFLEPRIGNEFTIISLDLPFHGETKWNDDVLDGKKLRNLIFSILAKEKLAQDKIYLIGFSLGGRIALSLFEQMPQHIERLVLLAPDGLKMNFWYWLSTQTMPGSKCFKWTMQSPGWFLGMLRAGNRMKIINRSIYKFVEYYIHDEKVREDLYDRWMAMRNCKPNLKTIRQQIRKYKTAVRLLYGKHDRIILTSPAMRFIDDLPQADLQILECGHQVLHAKNANDIVKALIN